MQLTQDQINTYASDGTVLIPNAFPDWVAPLRASVMAVIDGHRAGEIMPSDATASYQNPLRVVENFGGGVMALNMVPHNLGFAEWLQKSPAAEMTARVMQSTRARFWIDATFLKETYAASEGTPWHNDTCTWPFWGKQMAILWIALTDVDDDNAPLITVRGTHTGDGRYYSTFFPSDRLAPPPYKPWQQLLDIAQAPDADIQVWTMKAGDCLFMHPSTIHASKPRAATTGAPRLAFSTRWLGDDVVWKPDPLTERMTEKLTNHPSMRFDAPPPDDVLPAQWPRMA